MYIIRNIKDLKVEIKVIYKSVYLKYISISGIFSRLSCIFDKLKNRVALFLKLWFSKIDI